jgi:acyl-CoA dehydrogenase
MLTSLEEASRSQLLEGAVKADKLNKFSVENLALVRRHGLMGAAVPKVSGGLGLEIEQLASVALVIGKGCLSTALVWSMHSQQVAVLAQSQSRSAAQALEQVVEEGVLIASVTSEVGKGGDIFRALAPIITQEDGRISFERTAPTVSYGLQSQYYLVTLRADEQAPDSDVKFVLVSRQDGRVESTGEWNAMGVRGTQSIPMTFQIKTSAENILPENFRLMALRYFVPSGQILWAASWLGAVQGLFDRMLEEVAANKQVLGVKLKATVPSSTRMTWESIFSTSRSAPLVPMGKYLRSRHRLKRSNYWHSAVNIFQHFWQKCGWHWDAPSPSLMSLPAGSRL